MARSSRKTLRTTHRFFHKAVPAMIVGLLAVIYRATQEMGLVPKDVVLFPFLILLAWILLLYFIFGSTRARRVYWWVYNRWGERRRLMTYLIVISIGAVIGGTSAGTMWKIFEVHRQQMQKLRASEGKTETAPTTNTAPTPTPSPTPAPSPKEAAVVPEEKKVENTPKIDAPRPSTPRASKPRKKRPTAAELEEERRRIDLDLNYNKPE